MKNQFIEPVSVNKSKKSTSKSYIYNSYPNDRIVAPLDGFIKEENPNECDGKILIKHSLNNKTYYSQFCGVGRIQTLSGQNVYQGKPIGYFGDKEVTFTILDDNGYKQNIDNILGGSITTTKKEPEKKEKKEKERIPTSGTETPARSLVKGVLGIPGMIVSKIKQSKDEKEKEEKEKLKQTQSQDNDIVFEEVRRIKELMK